MQWHERLEKAMQSAGLSPEQLAERAKVPLKSVYGYLKGHVENPRGNVLARLAVATQTTEQFIRYGAEAPQNKVDVRRIPLLTMTQLGQLKPEENALVAWDGVTLVTVPSDVPESAFGVKLHDDSGTPEFSAGDVIICDPQAAPAPGRYVVAVTDEPQEAFFGRFRPSSVTDKGKFQVIPLNPDYPTVEVGGEVKGRVLARAVWHLRAL